MQKTNSLLQNAASKISSAMDRIKFDGSLTTDDFQKIRADVEEAKRDVNMFSHINQDPTGLATALERSIELIDRTLHVLDDSPNII
ncbi:hypothetical protein NP590_15570 [Methylomonas sp. SURF-2]|uniref:Uncharacterized protein n=1 Tax=Methylomonas subterranea TaxID=2952225 RepID=A0ABT1TJ79_9GAMM|nr:hypothetical protein [Methylomonas sp. SURF-2]MCQ8105530.1 hypothetical protein [Methylomonas sp. SURF-2]